jgi:O-antigen/teichoic acid export membrane protein
MAARDTDASPVDVLSGPDVASHVVRGGLQRAGGFVAINLLTGLTAIVLLRHLGVEDFGRYGIVMALLAIVQGVSDAGLSMTGARELAIREGEHRRELLAHLLGLRIMLTTGGILAAVGFAALAGYGEVLVLGTALAGGGVLLLSVQAAMMLPLAVELRNGRLTLNEVLRQAILLVGFVMLVAAGAALSWFFTAQLAAAVVVMAITPLVLGRRHLVWPRWSPAELRALAVMTLPLAISGVLSVLYFRLLVVLMSLLENSATEVGYYVTSTRVVELFLALPMMLVSVVLPVLSVAARDDEGRLRYVSLRLAQTLGLLGVLLALVLGAGADPLIRLLGGAEYAGAAPVLQIQCIALVTIFIVGAWTTTLVGMGRMRELVVTTAIGIISVLAFGLALIPPLGAEGAAIAAVAGDLVYCAAVLVALRRAGPGRGLPPGPLVRAAAAAVPPLLVAVASPLPAAADASVVALLFPLLATLFGAVPPEITDPLRRRLR